MTALTWHQAEALGFASCSACGLERPLDELLQYWPVPAGLTQWCCRPSIEDKCFRRAVNMDADHMAIAWARQPTARAA